MPITMEKRNEFVTELLNGTFVSLKSVVPLNAEMSKPQLLDQSIHINFGVLIGFTGDVKGKLVFAGDLNLFSSIGESMFGMPLEGEMLVSFSGELGNMIAGGLSTNIVEKGIQTDITSPTIMNGDTTLSGYKNALKVTAVFEGTGELDIYLLLD